MKKKNSVYIATSLDGFIADKNGGLEWLDSIPNPDQIDMGYVAFTDKIDALVFGQITFETVLSFDVDWPYAKPVYVLSNTMTEIPESHKEKAFLVKGTLTKILSQIHGKGHHRLYIDGGVTIQNFLKADLIDEMVITIFPVLLGSGIPLFSELTNTIEFELVESKVYLNELVQSHYIRKR